MGKNQVQNNSKISVRSDLGLTPKRVVVKLGSQTLTHSQGGLDEAALSRICNDIIRLWKSGLQVVLVSSGAIQVGRGIIPGLEDQTMAGRQALSAVGQPALISAYREQLSHAGLQCAQVLVTHEDLRSRNRFLNARQTILALLSQGVLPILNENDSVSFSEITVGDNDQLAAMVCELVDGDLLLMLTGPDGLYESDPALDPDARPLKRFGFEETEQESVSTAGKSGAGRGGMATKLLAAQKLARIGIHTVLCTNKVESPLIRGLSSEVGTLFTPNRLALNGNNGQSSDHPGSTRQTGGRKSWLISIMRSGCTLEVDAGARKALLKSGSLLPSGVTRVLGEFRRGDCIGISFQGTVFACGLAEYDSKDVARIQGRKSGEISSVLGYYLCDAVVHRNHFALKEIREKKADHD